VAAVGVPPRGFTSVALENPVVVVPIPDGSPGVMGKTWPPALQAVASSTTPIGKSAAPTLISGPSALTSPIAALRTRA
jgi:hypothetical protein